MTNPPLSDKVNVLKRLHKLGKPFIILLPATTLATRYMIDMFGLELHIIYQALWLKVYDWRGWITTSTGASLEGWLPGEWHHVVGTWNNYSVTLHLDGEEVARQEEHCLPGGAQQRLYVGWRPMNWYGHCAWHDLRVHDSPLPPRRVREVYAEGAAALQ